MELAIECQVVYQTADGIYVDVGGDSGLKEGDWGFLRSDAQTVAKFKVDNVATGSAFLVLAPGHEEVLPEAGAKVVLVIERDRLENEPEGKRRSSTLKGNGEEDSSLPLLAPRELKDTVPTKIENVFHGRLRLNEIFQVSDDDDLDYSMTRLRASGTVDRIEGTPWSFEWSGDVSYRAGDALANGRDFEELRLEMYRFSVSRAFQDGSFVRLGRFLPRQLSAVGFLDGAQAEKIVSEEFRLGAMAGFKPARDDLGITVDEPTAVSYVTVEVGERLELYYSGTAGVLFSLFDGKADRLAVLVDQTAHLGRLSLFASAEVDVEVGGAETYDAVRLTRLNSVATYPVSSWLILSAGADRFEITDTAAERDSIREGTLDPEDFLEDGYWRYWGRATQRVFGDLRLSEELSFYNSEESEDALRWLVSLSRRGFPGVPGATITLSVYNLESTRAEGYGARLGAYIPILDGRLSLEPGVSVRLLDTETDEQNTFDRVDEDFEVADVSLRAHWILTRQWSVHGGASYAVTDERNRVFMDVGVTFRW